MIQFNQTEIGYKQTLLKIDSLNLQEGKVYALVGRNGVGKSTLLQSMTKLIPLISGDIRYEDISLKNLSRNQLARLIAFVESKFDGVEFLSVLDYLMLGRAPYTSLTGKLSETDKTFVNEISEELQINYLLSKSTTEISDGERQICSVARALIQETPIILMDEPTAFLDFINRQKLLELLIKIAAEKQKCIVLSTHDIDLCLENQLTFLIASRGIVVKESCTKKTELINYFSR
ncbi:MAG: ABC transporter ATP-binding protein [Bacteroidetes bacterium]|nr:ABC transporter ATP-binding protein [Bacteroidota bacterium]